MAVPTHPQQSCTTQPLEQSHCNENSSVSTVNTHNLILPNGSQDGKYWTEWVLHTLPSSRMATGNVLVYWQIQCFDISTLVLKCILKDDEAYMYIHAHLKVCDYTCTYTLKWEVNAWLNIVESNSGAEMRIESSHRAPTFAWYQWKAWDVYIMGVPIKRSISLD
jgi:hypothetical protein